MPDALPWTELGLARVRVRAEGQEVVPDQGVEVVLEDGIVASQPTPLNGGEIPCAVYPSEDGDERAGGALDLRLFGRVLFPTLADHRLDTVCAHCGITGDDDPALRAARLLSALVAEAVGLDREVVALLGRLLPPPTGTLFDRILLIPRPEPEPVPEQRTESGPIDDAMDEEAPDAVTVLGADGAIARCLNAYEERAGQQRMAEEVEAAFRAGEALLVEAGPGTGKTFAYLVPAILMLRGDTAARVVVSTRTKQLQEQLFGKDFPFLVARLAPHLRTAMLKGRENYLCLRRWQSLVSEMAGGMERERMTALAPLARWILESETGDIDENSAFLSDPEANGLWRRLCDAPNHCTGVFCPFLEDCFSIAARRRARKADLVVVNHSLLLGDLAVGGVVLGRYSHLIVDEAHSLEPTARTAFTRSLSERIVSRVADELVPSARRPGWIARLGLPLGDDDVRRATEHVGGVRRAAAALFRELHRRLPEDRRGIYVSLSGVESKIVETTGALEQLEMALDRLGSRLEEEETRKELEGHIDRVSALGEVARALSAPPEDNTVHWYERQVDGPALHATPLDIAPHLHRLLYPRVESIVLTSATLSLSGDFEYLSRSLGLTDGVLRVRTAIAESPFSFTDRMKVAIPAYFPPIDAADDAYVGRLASLLETVASRLERKGLALFTSYQMLRAVRERLDPAIIATYAQGINGPRSKLVERFRAHEGPCLLLGTESFWEGVDFPGEELEYLVITRLPFAVPTDPIFSALGDRLTGQGRDPFRDLALPQAILKLRQGVGRLIRTKEDHGIVVLTDQRVLSRSYGGRFLDAFPVRVTVYDEEGDLVEGIVDWFARTT